MKTQFNVTVTLVIKKKVAKAKATYIKRTAMIKDINALILQDKSITSITIRKSERKSQ